MCVCVYMYIYTHMHICMSIERDREIGSWRRTVNNSSTNIHGSNINIV